MKLLSDFTQLPLETLKALYDLFTHAVVLQTLVNAHRCKKTVELITLVKSVEVLQHDHVTWDGWMVEMERFPC